MAVMATTRRQAENGVDAVAGHAAETTNRPDQPEVNMPAERLNVSSSATV